MLAVAPAVFGPILVTLLVLVLNLLSTVLAALLTGTTIGAPSPAPQRGSRAEKRQPEPSRGFSEASCKPPSSRVPLTTPRPTGVWRSGANRMPWCNSLFAKELGVTSRRRRLPDVVQNVTRRRKIYGRTCERKETGPTRSEEHTSELQSHSDLVCRLLLEKKKKR